MYKFFFRSNCQISLEHDDLNQQISEANTKVLKSFEAYEGLKSGWIIDHVIKLEIIQGKF